MEVTAPLAVGGNRLRWHDLPEPVGAAIESGLGARVVAETAKHGGFSPAMASVLTLDDGRRVFAKAIGMQRNAFTVAAIRRETEVLQQLPAEVPAPRPLWGFDNGEWAVLVAEAVDGRNPAQPWVPGELETFLAAATVLSERLSPCPIAAPAIAADPDFQCWSRLESADLNRLDERVRAHVDRLVSLERGWAEATAGTSLMHGDLRSDNFLLTADGFVVVDWPSVCIGPPWLDLLAALPSLAMHGGGDPQQLWERHPLSRGVEQDAANAAVAGLCGFFLTRALEPVPPLLPTIRSFQRAQGMIAFDWLRRRLRFS